MGAKGAVTRVCAALFERESSDRSGQDPPLRAVRWKSQAEGAVRECVRGPPPGETCLPRSSWYPLPPPLPFLSGSPSVRGRREPSEVLVALLLVGKGRDPNEVFVALPLPDGDTP